MVDRKRFNFGIAKSVRDVRDIVGGLRDEATTAVRDVAGSLRRRKRLL